MNVSDTVRVLMVERLQLTQRLTEIDEQLLDAHKMVGVEVTHEVEGRYNQAAPVVKIKHELGITKEQVLAALVRPMKTAEVGAMFMRTGSLVRPLLYALLEDDLVTVEGRTNARLWRKNQNPHPRSAMPAVQTSEPDDEPFVSTLPAEVRSKIKPVDVRCFGPGFDPRRVPCPNNAVVDGNVTRRCPSCARQHHGPRQREEVVVVFDGTAQAPLQSLLASGEYGASSLKRGVEGA